jgi:predicted DNA-binding ribbon-helix-helix protein
VKVFKAVDTGRVVQARRLRVGDRDVTIRLEAVMWKVLDEVCRRERRTLHEIVSLVASQTEGTSLASGLRVFALAHLPARRSEG